MPRTDGFEPPDALEHLGFGRRVVRVGGLRRAGGEDADWNGAPTMNAAALDGRRKLVVEHVLAQERIRHRDEERIDVHEVEEARDQPRSLIPAAIARISPAALSSVSARQPDVASCMK